jgi:hypothetical protein
MAFECLDTMESVSAGPQVYRKLHFLRGLAYYACGDDMQAIENLREEIRLTGDPHSQSFLNTFLKTPNAALNAAIRRANIKDFVEAASESPALSGFAAEQRTSLDSSDQLHEKLTIAKQFLSQGRSQQAAQVYRDLLSDNILEKHIALREKLKELVGLIESASGGQTSFAGDSEVKLS